MKKTNTSISKNFLLFFGLSVVFWFLTKLSKEYESTIVYPISFENLPKDKLMQGNVYDEIGIHVRATGFKILSGKIAPRTIKVDASRLTQRSSTSYFLLLSQQKLAIQKQMNTGVDIDHFASDSINLDLGSLKQKKLPIRLNSSFDFQTGYDISGKISLNPDSVMVSGPESVLDTLRNIPTIALSLKNVNSSFSEELDLYSFDVSKNIRLDVSSVKVEAEVEKFTEGTQKVSFVILNVPEGVEISTYPKEVDITYKVALTNFDQVSSSSFLIECDYKLSADNNLSYLVPRLSRQSQLVKNVKIQPSKIDFVIEK